MKLTEKAEEILEALWIQSEERGLGFAELNQNMDYRALRGLIIIEQVLNRKRKWLMNQKLSISLS